MTLKLRYNPMSPYIRKVVVMISETGLENRVQQVLTHPWTENTDIGTVNPLGKVPTLELEDGTSLYDSLVICDYLDSLHDGPKMIPASGMERWIVLRRHALGLGITDAAALHLFEHRRQVGQRSPGWIERQWRAATRGLDQVEREVDAFDERLDLGQIGIACAIGIIDFRNPDCGWRETRPNLSAWWDRLMERPSFADTVPYDWVPEDHGGLNVWIDKVA
ncbi:MAG: glutathione S-transferase N-terminal domain-containing protein [Alphaproteobacteria bacterium]|nr:glutathione S-transferase N-terminal domain-containing protein [Alphaproteobacteria bacterium]